MRDGKARRSALECSRWPEFSKGRTRDPAVRGGHFATSLCKFYQARKNVDGMRYYLPLPPSSPINGAAHLWVGATLFEPSGLGSRFTEAGIHSSGTQKFYSSGFSEGYLNEVSRVSPLFTIDEEVGLPRRSYTSGRE